VPIRELDSLDGHPSWSVEHLSRESQLGQCGMATADLVFSVPTLFVPNELSDGCSADL
jgi:hypothetical protein